MDGLNKIKINNKGGNVCLEVIRRDGRVLLSFDNGLLDAFYILDTHFYLGNPMLLVLKAGFGFDGISLKDEAKDTIYVDAMLEELGSTKELGGKPPCFMCGTISCSKCKHMISEICFLYECDSCEYINECFQTDM